ncbi:MAG: VWA domain-containing protein, partial [Arenicellales bacterium]
LKVIDKYLMPWLTVKSAGSNSRSFVWLMALGWMIAVIALANPVWEKLPQPVFQTDQARVIVLDLSLSMNTTDLKPTRIERARFKISDILAQQQEGVIGLVVFAGDAFVVSPLTRDGETIAAQLQALKPGIMPVQGSRADLGLLKAGELLKQAGRLRGEVLLLADSYTDERTLEAASELRQQGVVTSVLGIGTEQGAPLPSGHGEFVRNKEGDIVTTRLDVPAMQKLASAGGGDYVSLSTSDSDINRLMTARVESTRSRSDEEFNQITRWKETGPWLVLLLLPLAALAFRRGWLLSIVLIVMTGLPNEPAMAFTINDLWLRQDQQAHKALVEGDMENAAKLAQDPLRKGSAEYKQGNFEQAVKDFSSAQGAEAAYNKGNALAKLGNYQQAIDAYEEALQQQANMEDAQYNKEAVEKLLQQQQQQQQQPQQNQNNDQGQQGNDSQQQRQDKQDQSQSGQQSAENNQGQPDQNQSDQGKQEQNEEQASSDSQSGEDTEKNAESGDQNAFADAAKQAAEQAEDESSENASGRQPDELTAEVEEQSAKEEKEEGASQAMADEQRQAMPDEKDGRSMEATAEELSSEEQIAAEQWLRRIPDDPAGLLRRKLQYQYIQRGGQAGNPDDVQPW